MNEKEKINTTILIILAVGLLLSSIFMMTPFMSNRQPDELKLNDGEVLYVYLTTNQHFEWEQDEINWYKVEKDYHLIIDIKGDPTTVYFPFVNIVTWGIER